MQVCRKPSQTRRGGFHIRPQAAGSKPPPYSQQSSQNAFKIFSPTPPLFSGWN